MSERTLTKQTTVAASASEAWSAWTTVAGVKTFFAPDAHIADKLLVVARTAEASKDDPSYGITLFITPAKDPAITISPQDTIGFDQQAQIDKFIQTGKKLTDIQIHPQIDCPEYRNLLVKFRTRTN